MGRQVRTSISPLVAAATVSTPAARGFSRWSTKPPGAGSLAHVCARTSSAIRAEKSHTPFGHATLR
jgi:hypothetical protein